jgi:hypothetical protein
MRTELHREDVAGAGRAASVVWRALALAVIAAGCDGALAAPGPPPAESIFLRVLGADDTPIEGAEISAGAGRVARTDASGHAAMSLEGADGTRYELRVSCPPGFASPSRPLAVTLRRGSNTPEYHASCRRTDRTAVVAVRTSGAPRMPVVYLGREVARTDETGIALVSIDAKVGETFTLTLDTSDKKLRWLRPQSPEMSFSVGDRDELFAFEQKFTDETPKVYRPPPPKPYVPRAIVADLGD